MYHWNGQQWLEEAKLAASVGERGDQFGTNVTISGDLIVVGAHGDDDNGSSAGAAYAHRWDDGAWMEEAKLVARTGMTNDTFGSSVALEGDVIAVGAWDWDLLGSFAGGCTSSVGMAGSG